MRIATYNIWNEEKNMKLRFEQIIQEITDVDADVIGLQEVTTNIYQEILARKIGYPYCEFRTYTNEDEGLAILSKEPIESCSFLHTDSEYANSQALNIIIRSGNSRVSITNVHLPWDSVREKEKQIVAIDRFIHEQKGKAEYFILLGDLNSGINSSVHRYLTAEQSLNNEESNPYWIDIIGAYSALHGLPLLPTLDCINNPRWKGKNTIYAPENDDRIYILDNWAPMQFIKADLFGTKVSPVSSLAASDHYGVVVEIKLSV